MKTSSSDNFRVAPPVPDHEMLRLIGQGSYGEVWLARGVTGAMRAVKVVRRSDFQFDKTFEREFEGIRKYEPISRSHRGVVEVLHIGRNLDEGFYYYVMELGDDQTRGSEIVPEMYVARTLASDINQRPDGRLTVDECIEAGANLADGLNYLHECGLAHRDVKPSNVIFVNGVAKLADIGLVAASGQRTFVGTEGFVPPEGPGSAAADIYSLGMVLYEVSTGNDRLEFPELPHRLPEESERPKWRALNAVVCKACAQKPKDRYTVAGDFAQALRRIQSGKVRRKTLRGRVFRMLLWSGLLASALMLVKHGAFFKAMGDSELIMRGIAERGVEVVGEAPVGTVEDPPKEPVELPPVVLETGVVKISSDPGVEVRMVGGELRGTIDDSGVLTLEGVPAGRVSFVLEREGYRLKTVSGMLVAGRTRGLGASLSVFRPPLDGEAWTNDVGMEFVWVGGKHVARLPVRAELFEKFVKDVDAAFPSYRAQVEIDDPELPGAQEGVQVTRVGADAFWRWLTRRSRAAGYLTEQHDYVLNRDAYWDLVGTEEVPVGSEADLVLLMCGIEKSEFAVATFVSEPAGAMIYRDEEVLGTAGEELNLAPGEYELVFRKGSLLKRLSLTLDAGDRLEQNVVLEESGAASFGEAWENDLGMAFVPLGGELLFGVHEVRVKDFRLYLEAIGREWDHAADFPQGEDHPVVKVTRDEAREFCEWLTAKDRERERLRLDQEYRLPRDLEWSAAVGLSGELGQSPAARDGSVKQRFPWGEEWPPRGKVANLDDREGSSLVGYSDGFEFTSPVGSFPANEVGIYDLSGNVWEWVEESYGGEGPLKASGVVRGGCYRNSRKVDLSSSCRNPVQSGFASDVYGFRVVVSKVVEPVGDSGE